MRAGLKEALDQRQPETESSLGIKNGCKLCGAVVWPDGGL